MKTSVGRSMQTMTADNPMMQSQKFLVYLSPLFGLFGLTLPLGVLIYWVTTNSWTLAQSHYVYKKYPMSTPEGQAEANGKAGTAKTGTAKTGTAKSGTARTAKTGVAKSSAKTGVKAGSAVSGAKTRKKAGAEPEPEPEDTPETPKVVRQQPSRQSRSKRKR
jgi:YidC/Oxa1 family membrane protein insertase